MSQPLVPRPPGDGASHTGTPGPAEDRREFLKQVGRAAWAAPLVMSARPGALFAGAGVADALAQPSPPPSPKCPNGDFETGTFDGWQPFHGDRSNSATVSSWTPGIKGHAITTASLDPATGVISRVGEGSYAARVGNTEIYGKADMLAYTFVVTPWNQNFGFRYALVFQSVHQQPDIQPFFNYYVVPGSSPLYSGSVTPVVDEKVVADVADPFFKVIDPGTNNTIVYRDWTPVCLDLSAFVGQTMTIAFISADCAAGGHYGYAYIDGLCLDNRATASFEMPRQWCPGTELFADGSSSSNETSFVWSIEESDANGVIKPGTKISETTVGEQAGVKNLTALYKSKTGHDLECDKYYLVKLGVTNDCTTLTESVHLLHVTCPAATAGPDRCVGCRPSQTATHLGIGNPSHPDLTYAWTPAAGLDDPTKPSPFHVHGSVPYPITYTVVVTDETGCTSTDQVTLHCRPPTLEVVCLERPNCCGATISATAVGAESVVWSTGEKGTYTIDVTEPGTYTVTVKNPCGSVSESIVVPPSVGMTGYPSPIVVDAQFCPTGGPPSCKNKLYFIDPGGGPAGTPGAYNVTQYKLDVYDAAGALVSHKEEKSCHGFPNWHIYWDGTDLAGNIAPSGTYTWRLRFKNCRSRAWKRPKVRRLVKRTCVKWKYVGGVKLWCVEWNVPAGTTEDVIAGTGTVKLKVLS